MNAQISLCQKITFTNNIKPIYIVANTGRIKRLRNPQQTQINKFSDLKTFHFKITRCEKIKDSDKETDFTCNTPQSTEEIPCDFANATLQGSGPTDKSQGTTLTLQTNNKTNTYTIPLTTATTTTVTSSCPASIN